MADNQQTEDIEYKKYKDQVAEKLPKGFSLEEEKIKEAFAKGTKVEEFVDSLKTQEDEKTKENKEQKNSLIINEGENQPSPAPENENDDWKKAYHEEWNAWAKQNEQVLVDINAPDANGPLSFRLYENEDKKSKGEYGAEISYNNPHNVSLKGCNGNIPDAKYFEKIVQMAKANGTSIEFGNIQSNEFKAKLWIACLENGVKTVNSPSKEEFNQWPKELQNAVKSAFEKQKNQKNKTDKTNATDKTKNESQTNTQTAAERIKFLRKKISDLQDLEEAAKAAGGTLREEDKNKILKEGLSAEEIKWHELRGLARGGDVNAQIKLDERRQQTMTDEYKYEREVELDDKGQPKKDKDGKTVYKKDQNGKFIYKTNDKGEKIETAAYQAFKQRMQENMNKRN